MKSSSIPKLFNSARTAIDNAGSQAEIQKRMSHYGFTPKRMQEGKVLLEQALMLHEAKDQKYDERWELSSQFKADLQTARKAFSLHVTIARLAFRDEADILHKLPVKRIKSRLDEWLSQALTFYKKAVPHAQVLERNYSLSLEELQQSAAMIESIIAVRNQRLQKKGEAEEATRTRNQGIRELKAWLTEFRSVARIALKDTPQLLEALGIMVPSEK